MRGSTVLYSRTPHLRQYCYALPYVCVSECTCYIGDNSQVPRERPSLLYDHTNVILRVVV